MNTRLVLAVLLPFLALALQWVLWPWIAPFVWFLFFPAVFFSARLGGLWGGLASTVLSAGIVLFFFIPPQLSWAVQYPTNLYSVGMFLVMGYLFSDTQERLRRVQKKTDTLLAEACVANEKIGELYRKTLELDELKSQFFANVSHELRTPLTLILAPLEQRLHRPANPGFSEAERRETEIMLRNARLLYRHVTDLLDAAKLEAGRTTLAWARLDLARLARTMASHFEALAAERHIIYTVTVPDTLAAEADSEKLQRVLLNLLSNAFKFTPDGGAISLRLHEESCQAVIEVQDNGPGVPIGLREAIFERFRQIEGDVRRRYGGTGLGLAIVKDFVGLHGGTVAVGEAPGRGALFSVRLPLAAPAGTALVTPTPLDEVIDRQAVEELEVHSPPAGEAQATGADAPLVLIVEDNADMNEFIAATLRPHYRVACAFDGREGLDKALALHPDLILADVMMPVMSGDEMVDELRRQPTTRDVPIVMLTAKADEDMRLRMLKKGVQDYLNKPFSTEELLARMDGIISERRCAADKLSRSEARFEATFEQAAVGIALTTPDGRWLLANQKLCDIVGYRYDELLAKTFQDITHPDDMYTDLTYMRQILAGEIHNYSLEKRYIRKGGAIVWINLTVTLVRQADGSPDYFISVVQDIQRRKETEAQLRLWAESFEQAHFGLAISDARTNTFLAVNPAFARQRGFSQDELAGKPVLTAFHPDFVEEAKAKIAALDLTNHGVFESKHLRKNGESFPVMLDITVIKSPDGMPINRIAYALDITERRAMEQLVRDHEQRHRFALETLGVGEWELNLVTQAAVRSLLHDRIFGHDSLLPEWGYGLFMEHVLPEDRERVDGLFRQAVKENKVWDFECRIRRIDGHVRWIHARGQPRTNDADEALLTGIVMDITERKQAEEEIRLLNADLERRVAERTAELTAANLELDSFAYAVSHDLRAPLRAMSGFSQALMEDFGGQLQGEAQVYLEQIGLASRKMGELIDGLLVLSRSTRGELQYDAVDISALAGRLLAELAESEPERRVAVEVENGLMVRGDGRMVEAMMRNLLGNAWKYTALAEAPRIRVYAEERGGERCYCVADNGAGFDMAHANRLFQPFQRLHRQDEFPGIGIGLATVQRIVHRHGGIIGARGELGKGAVFYFTLPIMPKNEVT